MIRLVRICIRDYHRGRTHYFSPQSVRNTSPHSRLDISPSAESVFDCLAYWFYIRRVGSGYSLGVTAYFSSMGFVAILILIGYYFIPKLRRAGIVTVPELFSRMFGWQHEVTSVLLVMARDMGVTAGAAIGMAVVLGSVFDISIDLALIIT